MAGAKVLNGRDIASRAVDRIAAEIAVTKKQGKAVCLASVQAGEPDDITHYAKAIESLSAKLGVAYEKKILPEHVTERALIDELFRLNQDPGVTGILVLSPLPSLINAPRVIAAIDRSKDVEGRGAVIPHRIDFDRLVAPPTALAAMTLVLETHAELTGKEAVVVGRSDVVGRPVAMLLLAHDATVTICHSKTKDLAGHVRRADIVIAAAGKPEMIKGDWIKPGAVVIDVGDNTVDGKLVGDVEFIEAGHRAAFISPVPGGVGPLTNVMLMKNLLNLQRQRGGADGDR